MFWLSWCCSVHCARQFAWSGRDQQTTCALGHGSLGFVGFQPLCCSACGEVLLLEGTTSLWWLRLGRQDGSTWHWLAAKHFSPQQRSDGGESSDVPPGAVLGCVDDAAADCTLHWGSTVEIITFTPHGLQHADVSLWHGAAFWPFASKGSMETTWNKPRPEMCEK